MLRIIFFDRYDVQAQSIIVRDKKAFFKPSIRTYSYRIELINGGNADFTFKSLVREIITGVSLMLLFVMAQSFGIGGESGIFGWPTLLIAHITFNIPYVIFNVGRCCVL